MMMRGTRHIILRLLPPGLYQIMRVNDIVSRPMISFIKETMHNGPLTGVEIGVEQGQNAKTIFETLNIRKLYLIDPYMVRRRGYLFEDARMRLERFKDRIQFIKKTSDDAVSDIPDGLDFVYIDGCHDYEFVKRDIKNYYPKVRKNGVIGGHDFSSEGLGVVRAVIEFSNGLGLMASRSDWWIVKRPL